MFNHEGRTMSTTVTGVEDLKSEYANGVEPSSWRLHVLALDFLAREGKAVGYTADEYLAAVAAARRKHDLPDVHTSMLPVGVQAHHLG
jgi:hypothetical protein